MPFGEFKKRAVAFDCETELLAHGYVPKLVCASVATATDAKILTARQARATFRTLLQPGCILVGANIAYDLSVMLKDALDHGEDLFSQVFAKFDRREIYDALKAEAEDAIANGHLLRDPRTGGPIKDPVSHRLMKRYSLANVTDMVCGRVNAKENDFWRLRYAILIDVPMCDWPLDALQYPVDDARNTWDVAAAQCGAIPRGDGTTRRADNLQVVPEVVSAHFALELGAWYTFATDPEYLDALSKKVVKAIDEGSDAFIKAELVRPKDEWDEPGKPKRIMTAIRRRVVNAYSSAFDRAPCLVVGCCDGQVPGATKMIACKACKGTGIELETIELLPRTETGGVSTSRETLADSGDELLEAMARWSMNQKLPSTYIPALRKGLSLRPNLPLANQRVSYGGIVQLMPKSGGVREAVVARPGYVFSSVDLATIELVAWAQVCLTLIGESSMADAINAGMDTHSMLGADMIGVTYEQFMPEKKSKYGQIRNAAKAGNFTFAGLGGTSAFVKAKRREPGAITVAADGKEYLGLRFCIMLDQAPRCGSTMATEWNGRSLDAPLCAGCLEAADRLRDAWFRKWPESRKYQAWVSHRSETVGHAINPINGCKRGDTSYTQLANNMFSELSATGEKKAFYRVQKECYTDRSSPLWGSHAIAFIHDEIVTEHPENLASAAAKRVAEIMIEDLQKCLPDMQVKAEPALMRRLYKGAEPVFDADCNLIPWEPSE